MSTAHVYPMGDHSASVAQTVYPDNITKFNNVKTSYSFYCDSCHLSQEGPDTNFRPYLVMTGSIRAIDVPESMHDQMGGIDRFEFDSKAAPSATLFFHFTDDDLRNFDVVNYFKNNLEPNRDMLCDNEYDLDNISADFLMMKPYQKGDAPIIFVGVQSPHNLETDHDESGYNLAQYLIPKFESVYEANKSLEETFRGNDYVIDDISDDLPRENAIKQVKKDIIEENGIYKADGIGETASIDNTIHTSSVGDKTIGSEISAIREKVSAKYGDVKSSDDEEKKSDVKPTEGTKTNIESISDIDELDDLDFGDDN